MSTATIARRRPVGELLRDWRQRRRLSQLELSVRADISTRHLSFLETGRSRPSSTMVLRIAEELDVPLRDRNQLLLAAGFAPTYSENSLDSPRMTAVRAAVRQVLAAHEPFPAVVVDRAWNILENNRGIALFLTDVASDLLVPPINALRVTLHPDGLAPRIVNLGEWREHLLGRLRRQVAASADTAQAHLLEELSGYPCADAEPPAAQPGHGEIFVPLRLRHQDTELSFFSTCATFGTPLDITTAELAIESFFPADATTTAAVTAALSEVAG